MLHDINVNTTEMNRSIQILGREAEKCKKNEGKVKNRKNSVSKIKNSLGLKRMEITVKSEVEHTEKIIGKE